MEAAQPATPRAPDGMDAGPWSDRKECTRGNSGAGAPARRQRCTALAWAGRRRDRIRTALGAGRPLAGQFLTESWCWPWWRVDRPAGPAAANALRRWTFPGGISLALGLTLDWRAVTVSLSLSVITGVLFGLAPAAGGRRIRPRAHGARSARRPPTVAGVLLASQVAISLTLLGSAGLRQQPGADSGPTSASTPGHWPWRA
jgi:hypothetical protein